MPARRHDLAAGPRFADRPGSRVGRITGGEPSAASAGRPTLTTSPVRTASVTRTLGGVGGCTSPCRRTISPPGGMTRLSLGCDEDDLAAGGGGDRAELGQRAAPRRAVEAQPAGQEVGIAEVERRGDEAADVDARSGAEDDAVRIDQEDPAVRLQPAEQERRVLADDAVQHAAARGLLHEARELVGTDREAAVDDRARRSRPVASCRRWRCSPGGHYKAPLGGQSGPARAPGQGERSRVGSGSGLWHRARAGFIGGRSVPRCRRPAVRAK